MFDIVPNESPTHGFVSRGSGTYTFEHNDPANVDLFNQIGAVRKIPIEALRQTVEGSTLIEEPVAMPNYSALQNAATGDVLDVAPIGRSYKLEPHDRLFAKQADLLSESDLPLGDVSVVDRLYEGGLRAHRTIHFNDLQTTVGDSSDLVRCRMDIFNSVDKSWCFQIFSGAYRDLCRNTLVFGGEKSYHQKAKHTKNLSVEAMITKAGGSLDMWTNQREQMRAWQGSRLSDEQFANILKETICAKTGRAVKAGVLEGVNERLMNALLYMFDKEKPELGSTMWAAYNALTHWATHTNETVTNLETGKEYQTGKKTAKVYDVQRKRNEQVASVLNSDAWLSVAA
jgi:hypothetical protein